MAFLASRQLGNSYWEFDSNLVDHDVEAQDGLTSNHWLLVCQGVMQLFSKLFPLARQMRTNL